MKLPRPSLPSLRVFAFAVASAMVAACAPYTVVQHSVPSVLAGANHVTVSSDWSQVDLAGETEQEFLGRSGNQQRAILTGIQAETEAAIVAALRRSVGAPFTFVASSAPPQGDELRLVAQHVAVHVAYYVPPRPAPGMVASNTLPVKIVTLETRFAWMRGDEVTDVIEAKTTVGSGWGQRPDLQLSDTQMMRLAGRNVGQIAARFFADAQRGR